MTSKTEVKECPLCGERMRRKDMDLVDYVPGTSEAKQRTVSEWVCPECDYFEEIEEEGRK
jgi:Zn ribbon nucleic-acid-binding protein